MRLPPMNLVRRVQRALSAAGIGSVVGGSGLLASLGLVDTVNDWDLVTDADAGDVARVLGALGLPADPDAGDSAQFATRAVFRLDLDGERVDLLVGFAIRTAQGVMPVPAVPGGEWRGLTMARADEWRLAYRAMGRPEKATLLDRTPGDT